MSNNTEITIAPGTYQLVRDIANPEVDRRFARDWTKFPVFKAGTKYLVQAYSTTTLTKAAHGVDASLVSYAITQIGAREMHRIYTHSEVGQLLVAALAPIEESFEAQLQRLGASNYTLTDFVKHLITRGILTQAAFEIEFNAWLETPEE